MMRYEELSLFQKVRCHKMLAPRCVGWQACGGADEARVVAAGACSHQDPPVRWWHFYNGACRAQYVILTTFHAARMTLTMMMVMMTCAPRRLLLRHRLGETTQETPFILTLSPSFPYFFVTHLLWIDTRTLPCASRLCRKSQTIVVGKVLEAFMCHTVALRSVQLYLILIWVTLPCTARWVMNQRAQFQLLKQGKKNWLSDDRLSLLNAIGFDWSPISGKWHI
jgi:hypothetical protein